MIATTRLGRLHGTTEAGSSVFRNVPYAAPPVGSLRFMPAQPASPWEGARPADRHGPVAPQNASDLAHYMGDFVRAQDEDCLTLTIWTPAAGSGDRPVLLWLHGGAFVSGAGSLDWYSGARLAADADMVVVHANYRIGALGWLCWPGAAAGNMALSDQAMALRWVHAHIAAFGGDPARITLGGQSAGATTAARLMLDPTLRPLVRRLLLQSGGFGREPSCPADMEPTGRAFLEALQIAPDAPDITARLQAASVADILRAQVTAEQTGFRLAVRQQAWRPLLDRLTSHAALQDDLATAFAGLDVLIGITGAEGHAFVGGPIPADLPMPLAVARLRQLTGDEALLAHYLAALPGATPAQLVADLVSDYQFVFASLDLAERAAAQGARVHAYVFEWAPPASRFGPGHCIDLAFTFGTWPEWREAPMLAGGDPAAMARISDHMRRAIGSFVHAGVPKMHEALPWPGYGLDRHVMRVGRRMASVGDAGGYLALKPPG